MTTTSYDNNYMFPFVGSDWCSVKCENDLDYIEPFVDGDRILFQFVIPYGQYVNNVTLVDWNNVAIAGATISWGEYYGTIGGVLKNTINIEVILEGHCVAATASEKCFMIKLQIYDAPYPAGGGAVSLYIARSVKYSCTFCEPTLTISSTYSVKDCLGNYYDNSKIPQDEDTLSFGEVVNFSNKKRIYASLKKLPSKLSLSSNSNCYLYKSEIIEAYELQGTKLYPPYVARQIENIMLGRNFQINSEEYQVRGDSIFEAVKAEGMSMFRLRAQIEKCPCEVAFDCL